MSVKCKAGEKRQSGWLYFVKGMGLEVWKAKMARGGRKKKKGAKAPKKKAKKKKR